MMWTIEDVGKIISFSLALSGFLCLSTELHAQRDIATDYFSAQNILKYANHLYKSEDYLRAAGEYERYLVLKPNSERAYFFHRIGVCYRLSEQYDKALRYFDSAVNSGHAGDIRGDSIFQIGYCYYLDNDRRNSLSYLREHIQHIENTEIHRRASQLMLVNYLLQEDWEGADECLQAVKYDDAFTRRLRSFAEEGSALPQKSIFLTGVLSSIIPGSGKIYTGYWKESIYPLLLIGFAGWRGYRSFRDNGFESTGFWIYSSIGVYFHLANIYGSMVSAQNYNERQKSELLERIKSTVGDSF